MFVPGRHYSEIAVIEPEIQRWVRLARACYARRELYNMADALLSMNVGMLKTRVIEPLLYACVTWTFHKEHFDLRRSIHYQLLN